MIFCICGCLFHDDDDDDLIIYDQFNQLNEPNKVTSCHNEGGKIHIIQKVLCITYNKNMSYSVKGLGPQHL